jgi:hypothetical protein
MSVLRRWQHLVEWRAPRLGDHRAVRARREALKSESVGACLFPVEDDYGSAGKWHNVHVIS